MNYMGDGTDALSSDLTTSLSTATFNKISSITLDFTAIQTTDASLAQLIDDAKNRIIRDVYKSVEILESMFGEDSLNYFKELGETCNDELTDVYSTTISEL